MTTPCTELQRNVTLAPGYTPAALHERLAADSHREGGSGIVERRWFPGLAIAVTIVFMMGPCRGGVGTLGGRQRTIAAAMVAVAVLTACSFDYSDAGVSAEQLRDNVPETDLTDVTRTSSCATAAWWRKSQPPGCRTTGIAASPYSITCATPSTTAPALR